MPRYGHDFGHRGGPAGEHGRHDYGRRGYMMDPGWGWEDGGRDPNWAGGTYHGQRMAPGGHQAAYGRHRQDHQRDLGGHGGFDGRYDLPDGWFDGGGIYHEAGEMPVRMRGRYDVGYRREWENGGVQYGRDYLRQYNANSPALRHGGPDRSWGFAPGPEEPSMRGHGPHGRPTDERGYAGYNQGGFAEGKFRGPGTRGSIPNR